MKHETPIDLWLYEKEAFTDGFQLVGGVDEAALYTTMNSVTVSRLQSGSRS